MNKFYYKLLWPFVMVMPFLLTSIGALDDDTYRGDSSPSFSVLGHKNPKDPTHLAAGRAIAADLLENGYLVHLTRMNLFGEPANLKLYGGALVPLTTIEVTNTVVKRTTYIPNPDSFRPCVYFSLQTALNENSTDPHMGVYTQAVLIPAKLLKDQIVNLFPNDTAVWAPEIDLRHMEGCVIFSNRETILPKDLDLGGIQIERFEGALSLAVKKWLRENTGKCIDLIKAPAGKQALLDKAVLDGHDFTNPCYFDEFLHSHRCVSFGYERTPKRPGLGHLISYLNTIVLEFSKKFGYGIYKKYPAEAPYYISKYRVEPLLVLANHVLSLLEELLLEKGNELMVQEFRNTQRNKVLRAIENLQNYVKANIEKPTYQQRPYTLDVALRLANHPYNFVQTVLANKAFSEVHEEMEAMYWFWRYLTEPLDVLPVDELNPLAHIAKLAEEIRMKITEGRGHFIYIHFLNTVGAFAICMLDTPNYKEKYTSALSSFAPALPRAGKVSYKTKDSTRDINFKQNLESVGIKIPQDVWNQGITRMPNFVSSQSHVNSF